MIHRSENIRDEIIALFLVLIGVTLRVLPHPDNFTPVMAIALFSGVVLPAGAAFTVPLIVMIASDLLIGPHDLFLVTWGAFAAITLLGAAIRRNPKWSRLFFGAVGGSVFFFVVTNLGVFLFQNLYPKTWAGLAECFVMALPFFRNSLAGDLFYTASFFGLYFLCRSLSRRLAFQKPVS